MKMYVAYGSNMNVEQMSRRCPDAKVFGTGLLHGYKIVFRGRSNGVANIEPAEGSTVPVVLWKISPSDEKALDVYEGYPHLYHKEDVTVVRKGRKVKGMAYIMDPTRPLASPSGYYLGVIADGYDLFGLDADDLFKAAVECGVKGAMYED